MQYEHFSRHLREKYSTRLHVADQLVDRLRENNQSSIPYLERFRSNRRIVEPYFNECLLAAERVKKNRRSERDRQICYENLILAEKLERIKNQTGQNSRKQKNQNHCRLPVSKGNCNFDLIKSMNKELKTKQFLLLDNKMFVSNKEETIITSYHSPSLNQKESRTTSSFDEDDQATVADVDTSMEYYDSTSLESYKEHKKIRYSKYQNRDHIDMTITRDSKPSTIMAQSLKKHFSICILPRSDSDVIKLRNNHQWKVLSHNRQCAFKREILYD